MSTRTKRVETRRDSQGEQLGWAVVGPEGAIEFWLIPEYFDHPTMPGLGGVETHQRAPFDYSRDQDKPDHDKCPVLDGPCWHDGTSLWATEHWIPMYKQCGEEWVWLELEATYDRIWPIKTSEEA